MRLPRSILLNTQSFSNYFPAGVLFGRILCVEAVETR
jgi:hypothetical protein